jgi:predicted RNase H-like nuclease (RuvC/YqgF family)
MDAIIELISKGLLNYGGAGIAAALAMVWALRESSDRKVTQKRLEESLQRERDLYEKMAERLEQTIESYDESVNAFGHILENISQKLSDACTKIEVLVNRRRP